MPYLTSLPPDASNATALAEPPQHTMDSGLFEPTLPSVVDPLQRVPAYLETRRVEVPQWRHWLRHGEFERIQVAAQTMKSHAATLGLPDLEMMADHLKEAAKTWESRQVDVQLSRLANYLERPSYPMDEESSLLGR